MMNSVLTMLVIGVLLIIALITVLKANEFFIRQPRILNNSKAIYLFGQFIAFGMIANSMVNTFIGYCTNYLDSSSLNIIQLDFYIQLIKCTILLLFIFMVLSFLLSRIFMLMAITLNEEKDIVDDIPRSSILLAGASICIFYAISPLFHSVFSYFIMPVHESLIF